VDIHSFCQNVMPRQAYFDQLELPRALRSFFGRPSVRVSELMAAGMSLSAIRKKVADPDGISPSSLLFPVSRCWPMGFSWSSFVAQSVLLARCSDAGLAPDMALCMEQPAPLDTREVFGLATDDVFHFTSRGMSAACRRMQQVDCALANGGIVRNKDKDLTAEANGTIIGIDFCCGHFLAPHGGKLALVMSAVVFAILHPLSPRELMTILGHIQWFFLLSRPTFAVLDACYAFARQTPADVAQQLPREVCAELLVTALLLPALESDLRRPWSPIVTASDASVNFGFGACVAACTPNRARQLGRLAERRGDYVRLDRSGDDSDEAERPRLGTPHRLGLAKSAFQTVVQSRKQYKAHSSTLEAAGLVLLVRWILRSTARHSTRIVVLVDAKAVLGAAARGRSSSACLKREIRQLAALTLAGDLLLGTSTCPPKTIQPTLRPEA
jgi:hypothetical protein